MVVDFGRLLLSCTTLRLARSLHALLLVSGRSDDAFLCTKLLNLYSRLGDLPSAALAFRHAPSKSIIAWNSMIACYVQHGFFPDAVACFHDLLLSPSPSARPDSFTFPVAVKACWDLRWGKRMHSLALKFGLVWNVFVSASFVHMYSRLGSTDDARKAFEEMPYKDLGSWNAMLSGLCQNGRAAEAADVFERMMMLGLPMDKVTVTSVLPVCAPLQNLLLGVSIHLRCIKLGFDSDLFVSNAFIDMYAKSGRLAEAQRVFDGMEDRDLVTWNCIISGYEQAGDVSSALKLFDGMKESGVRPDRLTLVSLSSAAAQCGDDRNGRSVHGYILRKGWDLYDIIVGNAIVDMYGKLSKVKAAREVFSRMPSRDVISWNTLITAYSQNGLANEAIEIYEKMQINEGIMPIQGTLASVLPACAHVGALQQGMKIHQRAVQTGLQSDVFVATCLIDMYAKCGRMDEAMCLFEQVPRTHTGPWNAVIAGLGVHGHGQKAVSLFSEMQEGVKPDQVTFVSLLSACSHAGLVNQGREFFHMMKSVYGLEPCVKHYACMVDLLGRAGQLDSAYELIRTMPVKPDSGVWGALLGACRIHGNVELGKLASSRLFEIDRANVGYYVLLSNMYAKLGEWDGVDEVRSLARHRGLQKTPGWSSVVVNKKVNAFFTGNQSHSQYEEIQKELRTLLAKMKSIGYVPDYSFVLQDVEEDEEKEHILSNHSERLAIAFAIISTSPKTPIQIFKNLRVCGDCHTATKFISRITEREIIVRDSNRFHHFKEGNCSCGDYW